MKISYFAAVTSLFRQVLARFAREIEGARMAVVGQGQRPVGHVLPRRRYAQISRHARQCIPSCLSPCQSHHREHARTRSSKCSSHRVGAGTTSRSENCWPPEANRQSRKAFGDISFTPIRFVLSAVSKDASSRRTWSIASHRTAAKDCCSEIKRTGNRFARPVITNGKRASSAAIGRGALNRWHGKPRDRSAPKFLCARNWRFNLERSRTDTDEAQDRTWQPGQAANEER